MTPPQPRQTLTAIDLPPLPDEAVAALMEFLHEIVFHFEGRYFDQLHRYHTKHAPEHRQSPTLTDRDPDFDDPLLF